MFDTLILGQLFEGNLVRIALGFVMGYVFGYLTPAPKFITKFLGNKRS